MSRNSPCHSFQRLVANTPLLATTKTPLSERLINGSDGPRPPCAPSAAQPHPMLPHQPPHPDHDPTASTIKGNVTAEDPASVEKKCPIRHQILRGSRIFHDLPAARRTTARMLTTTHTGITAGPGRHAEAGAERDIEAAGARSIFKRSTRLRLRPAHAGELLIGIGSSDRPA
jgi:hypothetical protein